MIIRSSLSDSLEAGSSRSLGRLCGVELIDIFHLNISLSCFNKIKLTLGGYLCSVFGVFLQHIRRIRSKYAFDSFRVEMIVLSLWEDNKTGEE